MSKNDDRSVVNDLDRVRVDRDLVINQNDHRTEITIHNTNHYGPPSAQAGVDGQRPQSLQVPDMPEQAVQTPVPAASRPTSFPRNLPKLVGRAMDLQEAEQWIRGSHLDVRLSR